MISAKKYILGFSVVFVLLGAGCNVSLTNKNSSSAPVVTSPTVTDSNRETRLQPVVEDYLSSHLGSATHKGKMVASYIVYGEEEKNDTLHYYIFADVEEFYQVGTKLARANARLTPVALTIVKQDDLYAKIVGHQLPDPKRPTSIQQLFSKTALDKLNALKSADIQKRNTQLSQENGSKAQVLFGVSGHFDVDETRHEKCLDLTFQNFVIPQIQGNQVVDVVFDSNSLPSLESWKAATEGVEQNHVFAERYRVRSIGCGVKCFDHHIIDGKTNTEIKYIRSQYGLDFGVNSRLLIVNPYRYILDSVSKGITTQFYVLNDTDPNHPRLDLKCSFTDQSNISTRPPVLESAPTPATSSDASTSPNRRYFGRNQTECAAMNITCADNESVFADNSGCGCELKS